MAGVTRKSASKHLKRFEEWGLIELGYRFAPKPIVNTTTGEILGDEQDVILGRTVKLTGGVFGFLEALATFVRPEAEPRPHKHCHPDERICRQPCCQGNAEPDVTPGSTKKRAATGGSGVESRMSPTVTSGSKDPPDGFTTCAKCGKLSRSELHEICAAELAGVVESSTPPEEDEDP